MKTPLKILLYVPNLIGYIRVGLMIYGYEFQYYSDPWSFFLIYLIISLLDFFDGLAARVLNQRSTFGAFFDVLIDVVNRGCLWAHVLPRYGGWLIAVEWTVFVVTHAQAGHWKEEKIEMPWHVKKIMANGLHTALGWIICLSINLLPIWVFAVQHLNDTIWGQTKWGYVLIPIRLAAFSAESWFIYYHFKQMLTVDCEQKKEDKNK